MFKRKKKTPVPAVKNPPRVVKETKSYRFVISQSPCVTDNLGNVLVYSDVLTMEVRDTNAMEEPFWKHDTTLAHYAASDNYPGAYESNKLNAVVRELIGL